MAEVVASASLVTKELFDTNYFNDNSSITFLVVVQVKQPGRVMYELEKS